MMRRLLERVVLWAVLGLGLERAFVAEGQRIGAERMRALCDRQLAAAQREAERSRGRAFYRGYLAGLLADRTTPLKFADRRPMFRR